MTIPNVYAWNYGRVIFCMLFLKILWLFLKKYVRQDIWKKLNIAGACIAFLLILRYTVWGRVMTGEHRFMLYAEYSDEFFREMLMNCFLYFPLGVTLGEVSRKKTVPCAFLLSLVIETWQFVAGTGVAQGTDLLCNTLGAFLGSGYPLKNSRLSSILKTNGKIPSESNREKDRKDNVDKNRKEEVGRW